MQAMVKVYMQVSENTFWDQIVPIKNQCECGTSCVLCHTKEVCTKRRILYSLAGPDPLPNHYTGKGSICEIGYFILK